MHAVLFMVINASNKRLHRTHINERRNRVNGKKSLISKKTKVTWKNITKIRQIEDKWEYGILNPNINSD